MDRARIALALGLAALLLSAAVLLGASRGPSLPAAAPMKRTIYMSAVEPKGSAEVGKEPFPGAALPPGGGYALKPPPNASDPASKWEVEVYQWEPAVIVVNQGDEVTLRILGVNGKEHKAYIEGYAPNFTVERGQLTELTFKADKAGTFPIVCTIHAPSMEGYLLVLPRP